MSAIIKPSAEEIAKYMEYFPKLNAYANMIRSPHKTNMLQVTSTSRGYPMAYYRKLYFTVVTHCHWEESTADKKYGSGLGISPEFTHYTVSLEQYVSGPRTLLNQHEPIIYGATLHVEHIPKYADLVDASTELENPYEYGLKTEPVAWIMQQAIQFELKSRHNWQNRVMLRQKEWSRVVELEGKKLGPICSTCGERGPWEYDGEDPLDRGFACKSCDTWILSHLSEDEVEYWKKQMKIPNNPIVARMNESYDEWIERQEAREQELK